MVLKPSQFLNLVVIRLCVLVLFGAIFAGFGCGEVPRQPNHEPFLVQVEPPIKHSDEVLWVPYVIGDYQYDDAILEVTVCQDNACYTAVSAGLGDGTARVPTVSPVPGQYTVTRRFSWKLPCGLLDATTGRFLSPDLNATYVFKIRVLTDTAAPVSSEPFTLSELGFTSVSSTCSP